jgi:hypothetical protein
MIDVNGKEIKEGMQVYELGVSKSAEDQEAAGLPIVTAVRLDRVELSNGDVWKNEYGRLPLAIRM